MDDIEKYLFIYKNNNSYVSNIVYNFKNKNIKVEDEKFCIILKKIYKKIKYKNIFNFNNIKDLNNQINNDLHHRYYYCFFIDDFIEKLSYDVVINFLKEDKVFGHEYILTLYKNLSNLYNVKNLILGLKSSLELFNYFLVKIIFNNINLSGKLYYYNNKFILTNQSLSKLYLDKKTLNNKFKKYSYDYLIDEKKNYDKELYDNIKSNNELIYKNIYCYNKDEEIKLFLFFTENKNKYNINSMYYDEFLETLNSYNSCNDLIIYNMNNNKIIDKV